MGKPSGPAILHVGAYITPIGGVHFLCPLGADGRSRIKLPNLVGRGDVDVETAEYVQVAVERKPSGAVATKPPGKIVPELSPGQLSAPVRVVMVSATGS
jgi:hypothetical protein